MKVKQGDVLAERGVPQSGFKARIIVGAANAYCCISDDTVGATFSLDVRLNGGKSAKVDLLNFALDQEAKAAHILRNAERARKAIEVI